MKGNKSTQLKKQAILQALEQTLGVVTSACQKVGVGRKTFYEWLHDDEEFKTEVQDLEGVTLDFAESKLYQQIKEGNTTATIFYLKTKGKNRGYIERQEIQHSGEIREIVVNVKRTQPDED